MGYLPPTETRKSKCLERSPFDPLTLEQLPCKCLPSRSHALVPPHVSSQSASPRSRVTSTACRPKNLFLRATPILLLSNRFERHGANRICARKPENRDNQDNRKNAEKTKEPRKPRITCLRGFADSAVVAISRFSQCSKVFAAFPLLITMLQGLVFSAPAVIEIR